MADRKIVLSIQEAGSGNTASFLFHVRLDGAVLASNQSVSVERSRDVREVARAYGQLFESHTLPQLARDQQNALGSELFALWLAPVWERISADLKPADQRILIVASEHADIQNLPWELLHPPGGEPIGTAGNWTIRRLPWGDRLPSAFDGKPLPGPLRILFMVCAPEDQASLDYEREEELLLGAVARAGASLVTGDLGTFEELRDRINEFNPHIVHLTGHGMAEESDAEFAFEDERGNTDSRSAAELGRLFAGAGVQCAFLSGCQAGRAPTRLAQGGLCQGLLDAGVPLAIGWASSISDIVAIKVAETFYKAIAVGQTVDRALALARQAARTEGDERGDPSWSLPVLYASTTQAQVFDKALKAGSTNRPTQMLLPLPGMQAGYAEHFVGRRRELQRLLPDLRSGRRQVVVLTGIGGAGKSTLATRLARKLESDNGFTPIALSSSPEKPLTAAEVLQVCGNAFLIDQRQIYEILRDAQLPVADRLQMAVAGLNSGRFVLVLDNFESNLEEGTRRILDAELAGFYSHLLSNLVGESRVLVTSRYLPADVEPLPTTVNEMSLGEFAESAFLKLLLRDAEVERRYARGEVPHKLLVRLHKVLGGTPRFLLQIREVLKTIPATELEAELDTVALPAAGAEPGLLQQARDDYCERIFTGRLYERLDRASRKMLSRAAVFNVPVTIAGLAAATGALEEAVRQEVERWQRLALVHVDRERGLWSVYGMLRGWLTAPERLGEDEHRVAHRGAGDFLVAMDRQDREGELGLNWVTCLLEARAHYLAAGAFDDARRITSRVSRLFIRQGLYHEVERLNRDLLGYQEHPEPMNWVARSFSERAEYPKAREWNERALKGSRQNESDAVIALLGLGTIDVLEGSYGPAREKFGKALSIQQQIGDRAGEAATWHQLGTIDLNEGSYGPAREKFQRSLEIKQQIGDRAGEAATWHQLGALAQRQGNTEEGLRLIALCFVIDHAIGHGDAESDLGAVVASAEPLNYTQEQIISMLQQVAASYAEDRGRGLLRAAFPEA